MIKDQNNPIESIYKKKKKKQKKMLKLKCSYVRFHGNGRKLQLSLEFLLNTSYLIKELQASSFFMQMCGNYF